MKRAISVLGIFWLAVFSFALAQNNPPQILVDGIHGERVDLSATFPDYQFDLLTPADAQIDLVLYSGTITNPDPYSIIIIPVEVSGGEALLVKVTDIVTDYQLYVSLTNPSGEMAALDNSEGGIAGVHFDDPEAGAWTVQLWQFSSCYIEIGTGPDVINPDLLAVYDAIMRLWNEELGFLVELPEYSEDEEAAINIFLGGGKGFLYIREPINVSVDKPIIRLYSRERINVGISIDLPGSPTYSKPSAVLESQIGFTRLKWPDVQVEERDFVEIDYEGRIFPAVYHLKIDIDGSGSSMNWENLSPYHLKHLHLFKYKTTNSYSYAYQGDLSGNAGDRLSVEQELTEEELRLLLERALKKEAFKGGMTPEESKEFFAKYAWVERWLVQAKKVGGWTAIYQITGEAYDDLLPLKMDVNPREVVRILWVWLTNIPQGMPSKERIGYPIHLAGPGIEIDHRSPLVIHEYGIMRAIYPFVQQLDNLNFGGIQFYNEYLLDPTDNDGFEYVPIIHTFADNDLADSLRFGVEQLRLSFASPVAPVSDSAFVIAMGDEDAYSVNPDSATQTGTFPPGSYPPAVVASREFGGRIIGIGDMAILNDSLDNWQFMRNCLDWVSGRAPAQEGWVCINSDLPDTYINAISVHPYFSDTLYVATNWGAYQTGDGGLYWAQIEFSDNNNVMVSALEAVVNPFVNDPWATIYLGTFEPLVIEGFGGRIFRSWIDGEEWVNTNFPNFAVTAVKIFEPNPGVAFAGAYDPWRGVGRLYWLSSSGIWEDLHLCDTLLVRVNCIEVDEADSNFILAGTDHGVFITEDGGLNWSRHLDNFNISSVFITIGNIRMFYVSTNGESYSDGVYQSVNNGATWDVVAYMMNCVSLVQSYSMPSILYAARYGEGVFKSEDMGESWTAINEGLTNFNATCLAVDWQDPSIVCLGTENGIYRYGAPQLGVKDRDGRKKVPVQFGLFQNYPNPFNAETVIRYQLPSASHVRLGVYNVLGQRVRTLLDEEQGTGEYQIIWDSRDDVGISVASGIYFLRIHSGIWARTIKMVLLR